MEIEGKKITNITIENVANIALSLFIKDCLNIAEQNWCKSQVEMLEKLFVAAGKGCQYKCVGCKYFGRASDAPETVEEDCMWQPYEDEEYEEAPPCAEE